jgi:FkbM family methyltransferase
MKSFGEEVQQIKKEHYSKEFEARIEKAVEILSSKPFILWGAGAEGVEFAEICSAAGVPALKFADKYKTGTEVHTGLEIISTTELLDNYKDVNIVISTVMFREEIEEELRELGVDESRILPRIIIWQLSVYYSQTKGSGNIPYNRYGAHIAGITKMIIGEDDEMYKQFEETYNCLADEKSERMFIDFLRFSVLAQSVSPDPLITQYFDPVCVFDEKEVVVDCGAFTGDTAQLFIEKTNNKFKHYYAFEPDSENYKKLEATFSERDDITAVNAGIWSETTTLKFKSGHTASSVISSAGDISVNVVSIDDYFAKTNDIPTLIKMDIEGSESAALRGAENIIRKHKPKLAICVYHKPEDLGVIPKLIKEYRDDYKLYIRHYTDIINELVLYAI